MSVGNAYVYLPLMAKRWPPIPYAPTINAINNDDLEDEYIVSWAYNHSNVPVSSFTLQEATNNDFTEGVKSYTIPAGSLSKTISDQEDGVYCYRVRGVNAWGPGPWSGRTCTEVETRVSYDYDFSAGLQGWNIRRSDEGKSEQLPYPVAKDGKLYHLVRGKADYSILSPLQPAPSPPYTIEGYVDIVDQETIEDGYGGAEYIAKSGMTYGIIFGGNGDGTCPTEKGQIEGCLYHYYRILVAYDQAKGSLKWQFKRVDYHDADSSGQGEELIGWPYLDDHIDNALGWNKWRIEVDGSGDNNIRIYLNDDLIGQVTDTRYTSGEDLYFGVFLASPRELGAVATKWEWFRVEPR